MPKEEEKEAAIAVEVEPKTGVPFPVKLDDGKQLNCVGLRKKSMLGLGIKIYGFGNVLYIKISVFFFFFFVQSSAFCTVRFYGSADIKRMIISACMQLSSK